jgi:hypothetical protein
MTQKTMVISTINAEPNWVSYSPRSSPTPRIQPSTNIMMGIVGSSRRETSPPAVSLMAIFAYPCAVSAASAHKHSTINDAAVCTAIEAYGLTAYSEVAP